MKSTFSNEKKALNELQMVLVIFAELKGTTNKFVVELSDRTAEIIKNIKLYDINECLIIITDK